MVHKAIFKDHIEHSFTSGHRQRITAISGAMRADDHTSRRFFRRKTRAEWEAAANTLRARPLDATETSDFYEIVVERHRAKTTIMTSNREPAEWLTMTADTLLAQSAIDRLTSAAHTLVIEGPSYRQRTRPQLDPDPADEHPQ